MDKIDGFPFKMAIIRLQPFLAFTVYSSIVSGGLQIATVNPLSVNPCVSTSQVVFLQVLDPPKTPFQRRKRISLN